MVASFFSSKNASDVGQLSSALPRSTAVVSGGGGAGARGFSVLALHGILRGVTTILGNHCFTVPCRGGAGTGGFSTVALHSALRGIAAVRRGVLRYGASPRSRQQTCCQHHRSGN